MNLFHSQTLAVVFSITCFWQSAQSQDPQPLGLRVVGGDFSLRQSVTEPEPKSQESVQFKERGSEACVLLRNDNILFGQARQLGEFVIVQTGAGGEIRLPRLDVACWAESIRDLYQFRVDQRESPNLRIHLRDARWCIRYDLYDLAARELLAIRRIDPDNREADFIENQLRSLVALRKPSASPAPVPGLHEHSGPMSSAVVPAGYQPAEPDTVAFDQFTVRRFVSHIQPLLVNRCGVCHQSMAQSRHDGFPIASWKLTVPAVGSRASAAITRTNLKAITPYIDLLVPEKSPLLIMATTAHGDGPASLNQRNRKAIESLELWTRMAASSLSRNQSQTGQGGDVAKPIGLVDGTLDVSDAPAPKGRPDLQGSVSDSIQAVVVPQALETDGTKTAPHRLPQVSNPFDPDLFNRRFHAAKSN